MPRCHADEKKHSEKMSGPRSWFLRDACAVRASRTRHPETGRRRPHTHTLDWRYHVLQSPASKAKVCNLTPDADTSPFRCSGTRRMPRLGRVGHAIDGQSFAHGGGDRDETEPAITILFKSADCGHCSSYKVPLVQRKMHFRLSLGWDSL